MYAFGVDVLLDIDDGVVDLVVEGGDLKQDRGLRSAYVVSLFSDALASADEAPAGERRGWWPQQLGERWGSKLWLLERSTAGAEVLDRARAYATEAIGWSTDVGAARDVTVETRYIQPGVLEIAVEAGQGTGRRWKDLDSLNYDDVALGTTVLHILRG